MLKMNLSSLHESEKWEKVKVTLPKFDVAAVCEKTKKEPVWVHFGAGNIFRGFIAVLQQRLLNSGQSDQGIVAVETFDYDIIHKIYRPFDNLTMNVVMNTDGTTNREIIASIAEALCVNHSESGMMERLKKIFKNKSLQMVSFTITEKGYGLTGSDGSFLPVVTADLKNGPKRAKHTISIVTALLWERFENGELPIAVVSMDNCSHNGEKLQRSILTVAEAWVKNSFVEKRFLQYLNDEAKVTFPWSMIDKITPRPADVVEKSLEEDEIMEMHPMITSRNTYIAPFVNAESSQYLIIEDKFPNGRPALEKAGVYMTDRDTVNCTEKMKVTTCLNPLHTAMSVYGCMLGYTLISEEMKDENIVSLLHTLGYKEGLPVVVEPNILSPKAFIDEVIEERLPNPFIPDTPQRIATDTSQKVGIRFGETIKSYLAAGKDVSKLNALPLALAGWLRYLLAVDDKGKAMEVSADPLKEELQEKMKGIVVGNPNTYQGQLKSILANKMIFGTDLAEAGLAEKIEKMFVEELAGPGAVRATLKKYLK